MSTTPNDPQPQAPADSSPQAQPAPQQPQPIQAPPAPQYVAPAPQPQFPPSAPVQFQSPQQPTAASPPWDPNQPQYPAPMPMQQGQPVQPMPPAPSGQQQYYYVQPGYYVDGLGNQVSPHMMQPMPAQQPIPAPQDPNQQQPTQVQPAQPAQPMQPAPGEPQTQVQAAAGNTTRGQRFRAGAANLFGRLLKGILVLTMGIPAFFIAKSIIHNNYQLHLRVNGFTINDYHPSLVNIWAIIAAVAAVFFMAGLFATTRWFKKLMFNKDIEIPRYVRMFLPFVTLTLGMAVVVGVAYIGTWIITLGY